MSSQKRTNATASELGQLKASDKWEPTSKAPATPPSAAIPSETTSSSAATAKMPAQPQQSRDPPKSAESTQQDAKNINSLDEDCLKHLLEEAISYKGPKDKENKSETFKKLLQTVEQEDKERTGAFLSARQYRGNSRRHGYPNSYKSGSLQDLVDSDEQLDVDYLSSGQYKRHQQSSRYTKYSSSVSSRQREGGSLPTNVNHPVSFDSQFYNSRINSTNSKKSKESHDNERSAAAHHNRNALTGDSISHNRDDIAQSIATTSSLASGSSTNDKPHTIIDIEDPDDKSHILAHDSLAQGLTETGGDEGTELEHLKKSRSQKMSHTLNLDVMDKHNEFSSHNNNNNNNNNGVDKSVDFFKVHLTNPASLLKTDAKISLTSVSKTLQPNTLQLNARQLDENGNAISPKASQTKANQIKPRKRNRTEKNVTTWTVEGGDAQDIDSIVAFVESGDISKKQKIINVNKNNLSNQKEKKKPTNKKEGDKLKRSTSMEDLRSSSNIAEEPERSQVSLRPKNQKRNANAAAADAKETGAKQQPAQQPASKRGERRSWGTEELNYLGERDAAEERDARKPTKEVKAKSAKISEQTPSISASVESIPSEAAGFHVVTKKKKTKKRQIIEEAKSKQQQQQQFPHGGHYARDYTHSGGRNPNHTGTRYQPSTTYTNDRDVYLNAKTTQENRRKSTSSSDSSDLDSTHSLPIESSASFKPVISYAEIARSTAANQPAEKQLTACAWPPVSQKPSKADAATTAVVPVESPTASAHNDSMASVKAAQPPHRSSDASPKTAPTDAKLDEAKPIAIDAKPPVDAPKAPSAVAAVAESTKSHLQKSKSLDSEKYAATMNLDQFPGLEKTVKPPKYPQNFASVLASTPSPQADKSPKVQSLKKSPAPDAADSAAKKSIAAIVAASVQDEKADAKVSSSPPLPASPLTHPSPANLNQAKLVFVQNSTKAEEIANSGSSNLFMSINSLKKGKKLQPNASSTNGTANAPAHANKTVGGNSVSCSTGAGNYVHYNHININSSAPRVAVVFSDQGGNNNENVSPLLFGDFNDDILQLMKQEIKMEDINGNAYDANANHLPNHTDSAADAKLRSDPSYASAKRTNVPTESHEVLDIHQGFNDTSTTAPTTELSQNKKNTIVKRINLNKTNVNSNTSDVVSNQSIVNVDNDTNPMQNNSKYKSRNYFDGSGRIDAGHAYQTAHSDSDKLNNNVNDGDTTKAMHTVNNVNKQNARAGGGGGGGSGADGIAARHAMVQGDFLLTEDDAFNERKHFNNLTGKLMSSANSNYAPHATFVTNDMAKVSICIDGRSPNAFAHNHEDIVSYVVSAWEDTVCALKSGRACYFTGQ